LAHIAGSGRMELGDSLVRHGLRLLSLPGVCVPAYVRTRPLPGRAGPFRPMHTHMTRTCTHTCTHNTHTHGSCAGLEQPGFMSKDSQGAIRVPILHVGRVPRPGPKP